MNPVYNIHLPSRLQRAIPGAAMLSPDQASTVSGGCSNPHGCSALYQPTAMPSFSFALLGNDLSSPAPSGLLPSHWDH